MDAQTKAGSALFVVKTAGRIRLVVKLRLFVCVWRFSPAETEEVFPFFFVLSNSNFDNDIPHEEDPLSIEPSQNSRKWPGQRCRLPTDSGASSPLERIESSCRNVHSVVDGNDH